MASIAYSLVSAAALALITGWLGFRFGTSRERERERRARNLAAAAELVAPLREFQRLLRSFGRIEVAPDELTKTALYWAKACDDHGHRLPGEWRHVARSVRAAVGTVFDSVAFVHIRPDTAESEIGDPDAVWQDFADDFLNYVAGCVLVWGDASRGIPRGLMTYDEWLVRTERREPNRPTRVGALSDLFARKQPVAAE